MTARLGDYIQDPKFEGIRAKNFSLAELIDIIKTDPLLYEPGMGRQYSNSGYAVLGTIIEKITMKSYQENLKERIAAPVGMKNIYYTKIEKTKQQGRAFGTSLDFDGNKMSIDDIENSTPAGGLYTSVGNLLKFTEAKLKSILPSGKKYGRGMFAGGTDIWNSTISYNDKSGFAIVVMSNMGKIADELASRINLIVKGEPYPPINLPFNMLLYKLIKKNGIEYIKVNASKLAEKTRLPYDARFLNYFGYEFLKNNKKDIAIKMFTINAELFPEVPDVYDSLAEGYLDIGDKINALKYYKKELLLAPNDKTLETKIKGLETGK